MPKAPAPTLGSSYIFSSVSQHSGKFLCVWLNGLSLVLGPSVTREFRSWLDAWSTSSNIGLISHFVSFFQHFIEFLWVWLNGLALVLGPSVTRGFQSWLDAWSTNSNTGLILKFYFHFPNIVKNFYALALWIELNVGALGNEEVPKSAGCLEHQLQC
jgi:hypothetical protein